jgi:tRNA pseudouridine55 synthase
MTLAMAKAPPNPINGWLVLDKPYGMNSTKAVAIAKRLFRADKCGHAGTLDPLASGLLPIAFGEATKTVQYAQDGRKQYRFTAKWGEERSTDDMEGEIVQSSPATPSKVEIESILNRFIGEISQIPPAFSAIKVEGERSYDLARSGEPVELKARTVHVESLALVASDTDSAIFETVCGKGTYIRSLARDMGRELGCFGHVTALRRTAVGPFAETDMIPLDKLEELSHNAPGGDAITGLLRPLETVLDGIPAWPVKDAEAQRLRQGQSVLLRGANAPIASDAVLVTWGSIPLGICSIEQGSLKPRRLFNLS